MTDPNVKALRALLAEKNAAQAAFDESDAPIGTTEEDELARASIRADAALERAVMEALPALLDAAEGAGGLVFGPPDHDGFRRTRAIDDCIYSVAPSWDRPGEWFWTGGAHTAYAATESAAISAANAHNAARLAGR